MIKIEEILKQYANGLYVANIIDSYGAIGEAKLNQLTNKLRQIYTVLDVRKFELIYVINSLEASTMLENYQELDLAALVSWHKNTMVIELSDNSFKVCEADSIDVSKMTDKAIVYELKNKEEAFYMSNGEKDTLTKLEGHDSYYLKPTFKELDEALKQYKFNEARTSSCVILRNNVWADSNRVVLKARPEWIMRDSLFQFLKSNLRNYREILREQNVNESKPIDIKIAWNHSNRVALIEVKWIGMSNSGNSYTGTQAIARVNEGAEQLVEYLNLFNTEAPHQSTRGYLVTFDARRSGVNKDSTAVTIENGFAFKDDEIELNPDYPSLRNDFEPHMRFFLEPKCSS